jgi:putative flavoprotein involved in K+ transport
VVETDQGRWTADAVVVASGACNLPRVPAVREALPGGIVSLTAWEYRSPDQVPDGGVLVVGASAGGVQIADELLRHGRPVSIAAGEHVRVPRRYRGADILWWMEAAGVLDERYDEMDDLVRARSLPSMQLAGAAEDGTLDLNALTGRGARLHGRLAAIRDGVALFSGSLPNVCSLADLKLARLLDTLDAWAEESGVDVPEPAERLAPTAVPSPPSLELDLRRGEIRTVIWATGYRPDLSWLGPSVVDSRGRLVHDGGVTRFPGLYLMGMPFLRRRKSTLIDGSRADAADLIEHLAAHLDSRARPSRVAASV